MTSRGPAPGCHINDVDGTADFSRGPGDFTVLAELDMARALANNDVFLDLEGFGVDPVQHAGGFGGVYCPLTIRAHRHAFGFDTHINLGDRKSTRLNSSHVRI